MIQAFRHEMRFRDMIGTSFSLRLSDLIGLLASRFGIGFLGLTLGLLLLSDPPGLLEHLSLMEGAFVWLCSILWYIVVFFLIVSTYGALQRRGWFTFIWTPLIGIIAIVPTVSASEILIKALAGPGYQITILGKIAFYYLIVQIIEFAFVRLILPKIQPASHVPVPQPEPVSEPDAKPEPERGRNRVFKVGDRSIPVRRVRYLNAQEHYVRVVLDEEEMLHRVFLTELVDQLDPSDGVRPHRSWWVGRHAKPRLVRKGNKASLFLYDGTEVPVARGRIPDVVAWIDTEGPFGLAEPPTGNAAAE